jgi:hypothetical protein
MSSVKIINCCTFYISFQLKLSIEKKVIEKMNFKIILVCLYFLLALTFQETLSINLTSTDSKLEKNNLFLDFLENLISEENLEECILTFDWNKTSTNWTKEMLKIVSHFNRRDGSK